MKKKAVLCITSGVLLILFALSLFSYNFSVSLNAKNSSKMIFEELNENINNENLNYKDNPNIQMPTVKINGYDCIGTVKIPALNVTLPVISNWSYKNLRLSPCRYSGSVYQNNLIICAHNFKWHFGKIKNLKTGDKVEFCDVNGNVFNFNVSDIETVNPTAPENMTNGEWDLTLFTCTVGGTARVTVRCVRESDGNYGI